MKSYFTLLLVFISVLFMDGQNQGTEADLIIEGTSTEVRESENGGLLISVSPSDLEEFTTRGYVRYSDFGALADGKTDAIDALAATHAFANKYKLAVKADRDATYYISGKDQTAIIQTDTDFGNAAFIIDDTDLENRQASLFLVSSSLEPYTLKGIQSLRRNQKKIDVSLESTSIITVTNEKVKHYIRFGLNQNNGSSQTDIFLVDKEGNVDMDAPIIWDFDEITDVRVLPMDEKTLHIKGGRFTTIANQEESKYNYHQRNILIHRSNVLVDSLEHHITGEKDHGAPYAGFLNIRDCANVTVQNSILTGHKTYQTIGAAGKTVSMGSYDLSVNRALNVSFINCSQTNDIDDKTYWGILGSNFCKNLLYDGCTLSRFDAHQGVANVTIRNSTLGHMGINAIGSGVVTLENSTVRGRSLINLRPDYGSTWRGEIMIKNCIFVPHGGRTASASLIGGYYTGKHDFGYTCYMPEKIIIENLHIDDSNHPENYEGPAIFTNFNPEMLDESYVEEFPYVITKEVVLNNVTTASGKELRLSENPVMFNDVKVIKP